MWAGALCECGHAADKHFVECCESCACTTFREAPQLDLRLTIDRMYYLLKLTYKRLEDAGKPPGSDVTESDMADAIAAAFRDPSISDDFVRCLCRDLLQHGGVSTDRVRDRVLKPALAELARRGLSELH